MGLRHTAQAPWLSLAATAMPDQPHQSGQMQSAFSYPYSVQCGPLAV